MSQHDFDIANQSAAAFRADLNEALRSLATSSSGSSAPTTTYANQLWFDTSNNTLKIRNKADSDWIDLGVVSQSGGGFLATGLPDQSFERVSSATISSDDEIIFTDLGGGVNADELIVFSGLLPSEPTEVYAQTSSNNGSSFDAVLGDYRWEGSSSSRDEILLSNDIGILNPSFMSVEVPDPMANENTVMISSGFRFSSNFPNRIEDGGVRFSTQPVNAIRIFPEVGTFASGKVSRFRRLRA